MQIVTQTNIAAYPLLARGKVRDIYQVDNETLLIVTTDRMSAFDVIMNEPVPYKGVVLNQLTLFWMDQFKELIGNHLIARETNDFPAALKPHASELEGRSVLVRKARAIPVECIVRGYLSGSGWSEYQASGSVGGQPLPAGLAESAKLPVPLFTPSTKAELGQHDENISQQQAAERLGNDTAEAIRALSLAMFARAEALAAQKGIIIADTKFEFGFVGDRIIVIDEVLTPDSSRFWPAQGYAPGASQPSFDKQYLRDWLDAQNWNHNPPPPPLPAGVVEETARKYREAYTILTGKTLIV